LKVVVSASPRISGRAPGFEDFESLIVKNVSRNV
jgi:hypothetical protein